MRESKRDIKILFIADEPSPGLWDYFDGSKLEEIDLIISCGDLPPQYLSFLATFFKGRVLYVHGNHDDCYTDTPPEGCVCIDDRVYEYEGIRIGGLGGSMKYREGRFQYTERQMLLRTIRLQYHIFRHRGLDILVSHAPAYGVNDGKDLPHRGFKCFHRLLEKYQPGYFVHGHMHFSYNPMQKRISEHGGVTVINAWKEYTLEYPGRGQAVKS